MMKKSVLLTSLMFYATTMVSQTNYMVSWGYSDYDTLSNYISIYDSVAGMSGVEVNIQFGFSFPFFDSPYSTITLDGDGYGIFPGSPDYNLFLFASEYESHDFSGITSIHSDWRYKNDTANGLEILKVEWKDVGIWSDVIDSLPSEHRINFQAWFFENGVIEIHFGNIDLSNTDFYIDSFGFVDFEGGTIGPWVGIGNFDLSEVYYITGTNSNVSVITLEDSADIFYDVPEYGQFFRFTPNEISGLQPVAENDEFFIDPNPVTESFTIRHKRQDRILSDNAVVEIYSVQGELVISQLINEGKERINVSQLPAGIYFVRLRNEKFMTINRKVIKQ